MFDEKKVKNTFLLFVTCFTLSIIASSKAFASDVFIENFIDSDGTELSVHNSLWSFADLEPIHKNRHAEYKIFKNMGDDGKGYTFSSNKLDFSLSNHFSIKLNFNFSERILSDTYNQHFIDIWLRSVSEEQYIFRFWLQPEKIGHTLNEYDDHFLRYSDSGTYNKTGQNFIQIEYFDGFFQVFLNEIAILSFRDSINIPKYLILSQSVNTASLSYFEVRNYPVSTPTPVPTPTPFPITHFSQRDQAWKSQEYDKASQWSPNKKSFEYWGCAVTAASTVLDYYGIHLLPNTRPNNPGELNAWLKSQPDGYLRYGALNWNAVSRASRLASLGNSSLPALEYKYKTSDQLSLYAQLSLKQPVILEVPGHFVTAYQYRQNDNIVDIVDPYWTTTRTTLASYNNTYISKRSFVPSHTDLSYILSTTDTDINSKLFRKENNVWIEVSDVTNYTQNPILNQEESFLTLVKPFNVLEYSKPLEGEYELRLHKNSPGQGEAQIYAYDLEGNPIITPTTTYFGGLDLKYLLTFTKSGTVDIKKKVDFDSLIDDVVSGRISGVYKRKYNAQDLVILLTAAKSQYFRSKKGAKMLLESCKQIVMSRSYYITPDFYNFLLSQISLAETNLF